MGKKKGKAQNGRAKQKQKAKGGTPRTPMSREQRFARQVLLDDDWEQDSPIQFRGFSQTTPSSSFAPRSANSKLRHQNISFVSAGVNQPNVKPPHSEELELGENIVLDDSSDDDGLDDEDIDDDTIVTNIVVDADIELSEKTEANLNIETVEAMDVDTEAAGADSLFIVDTTGDASLVGSSKRQSTQHRPRRQPSPTPSSSSDEVVVFHGRNRGNATVIDDPVVQAPRTQTQHAHKPVKQQSPHVTDDLVEALRQPMVTSSQAWPSQTRSSRPTRGWGAATSRFDTTSKSGDNWSPAPEVPYWKKGKGRAVPRPDLAPTAAEKKALENVTPKESRVKFSEPVRDVSAKGSETSRAASTVQSITSAKSPQTEQMRGETRRKRIDQDEPDFEALLSKSSQSSRRSKKGRKRGNKALRDAMESDESDGDSEAAYDDYMQNLKAQLEQEGEDSIMELLKGSLHSQSIAGPSMVVDGTSYAEDEVLPKRSRAAGLDSETGSIQMKEDSDEWESTDTELNPDLDELSSDDALNASDLEDELEYSEQQQWEDEEDLRQRRIARIDDEQLAKLFAKQQELGIEGDELLIEDGIYGSESEDGFGDIAAARAGLSDITNSTFARTPKKHGMRPSRGRQNPDVFPDASALADTVEQYGDNGFDIMDFERPSLRPMKRGRKGKLPPELEMLSDEDIKDSLRNQWASDRSKKAEKKLEREELRAAGLLGSAGRKGKADLKARYPLGMSMRNIHDELRDFLQNDDLQMRAFPPMDKINRKSLHEICIALNLSSKSQGAGRDRFPIIYKTSRTADYSEDMYNRVLNASTRGFLTTGKAKKMSKQKPNKAGRGGGFSKAATGLRDGEVVGAGAAEIGSNNFGHRMMEKMGWTKGAGLGKDGEGRLHHVEQVMRTSKAGLG